MRLCVLAVALGAAAGFLTPVLAQPVPPTPHALVVPYLPQTEALCGGASAAMVMRYWGAPDIYPDLFRPLVDRAAGGIHTSALVADLTQRGWTAVAGPGDTGQLSREVGRGRPVIALIEDRPGRYHYVVVVSVSSERIVVHDPARAPSRVFDVRKFDAVWQKSERWMLILLPPASQPPGSPLDFFAGSAGAQKSRSDPGGLKGDRQPSAGDACSEQVDAAIAIAGRGDKTAARRALEAAADACPGSSAPWRELAGLDAVEQDWTAAEQHARRAVEKNPGDAHAWRVLATAQYLRHDDLAALAAWNRIGEPRVDLVDIKGLTQTRYMVVADAIGVTPRAMLTPAALRLAQRRVLAIPSVAAARLSFQPLPGGRAQVDASVVERVRAPVAYPAWIGIGLRGATERELATSFAGVSGGGDLVAVSWRWWKRRPMIAASYAAPGPGGIWRVEVSRETQTFDAPGAAGFAEIRTRAAAEVARWIDQRTRVSGGAAIEGWTSRSRTAALSGRVEFWPIVDRLRLELGGTTWRGGGDPFSGADAAVRWRSSSAAAGTVWHVDAGYRAVSSASPASIWAGADAGHARDILLRAHPLLDGGVIRDGVFGRRLAFGTLEVQHWLKPGKRPLRWGPAAFVDIARATRGLDSSISGTQVDAGAGLRVSLLGMGVLRMDVAHSLRDGRSAFSVGWQR